LKDIISDFLIGVHEYARRNQADDPARGTVRWWDHPNGVDRLH
jgi:hypothetical protein